MTVDCLNCKMDYIDCCRFGRCLKELTKDECVGLCDFTWTNESTLTTNNSTRQNFMEETE